MTTNVHIGQKLKLEAERLNLTPTNLANIFGVKTPSVYDWFKHGRIHKKHYPALVTAFDRPIEWWLGMPTTSDATNPKIAEPGANVYAPPHRLHSELCRLFDALPAREQDQVLADLRAKVDNYTRIFNEMRDKMKGQHQ